MERGRGEGAGRLTSSGTNAPELVQVASGGSVMIVGALLILGGRGGREAGEGRTTGVTVAGITSHVCGPKKKEGRDGRGRRRGEERRGGGGEWRRRLRRATLRVDV